MPNLPILTASTTCQRSLPVDLDNRAGANDVDFQYSRENCTTQFFVNASSSQKLPVSFTTPTTSTTSNEISSSSDFYVDPVFTGGDIIIILFCTIGMLLIMAYSTIDSLKNVKTKKTYLQYGGGDVEIREDN